MSCRLPEPVEWSMDNSMSHACIISLTAKRLSEKDLHRTYGDSFFGKILSSDLSSIPNAQRMLLVGPVERQATILSPKPVSHPIIH